jgi:hypothetical protein
MRIGLSLPACGVLALAAALVLPGQTAARSSACEAAPCSARILVGPEPVVFVSKQRFDPAERRLSVALLIDGAPMRPLPGEERRGCRRRLHRSGTNATVSVCGRPARLEVRASRTWGGSVRLEIRYRARPVAPEVKGVSAGSAEESGGVAPAPSGGVGA